MQVQGRKEITEAVITATLCTVAAGIVGMAFKYLDRALFAREELKPKPEDKKIGYR